MLAQEVIATIPFQIPGLLFGAAAAYLLVMKSNPVRACFSDGLRATGRYRALWITLGFFGFFDALFQLGLRVYFHAVLPPAGRPTFFWIRDAWRDPVHWLSGTPESLWFLPQADFLDTLQQSKLPALEHLAGIFNNLAPSFPVSALAAVLLLANWNGHHSILREALRKRFGRWTCAVHLALLLCALAAILKPFIYVLPQLLRAQATSPAAGLLWFQWAPVVVWLSSLFEYLLGVGIQIYLVLLAYVWVRGLSFTHQHLRDFAVRRFSFVVKWAALVMLLSSLFIEAPLILKNFAPFAQWFPEATLFTAWLQPARAALATFLLLSATMQITLTFHNESWSNAVLDHLRFLARHSWPFAWFLIIAALHLYALHVLNLSVRKGVGEGGALWVLWTLLFPWLAALVSAWLLASWVSLFKRCDSPRATTDNWLKS